MSSLLRCLSAALLPWALAANVYAQFNLKSWVSFEDGRLPSDTVLMHHSDPANTLVVDYATLNRPEITAGVAASECGRYGIRFQTTATQKYLCIMAPAVLQRDKLGTDGRALFQADFYMDGNNELRQTMSVVAFGVDPANPPRVGSEYWTMYRFGVIGGRKTFFSYQEGNSVPKIYHEQTLASVAPKATKGWHRFQFVVEGNKGISCYLDGIRTSFSPVPENSLVRLQPGLIVGAPDAAPATVYMDNLSIQWTLDPATPMPRSPWTDDGGAGVPETRLLWKNDLVAAMVEARRVNKPVAILFYMHGNRTFSELNNILQTSDEVRAYLDGVIPVRVDVNQLMGADLARRHAIVRVPTIAILTPDGTDKGRVVMLPGENWNTLQPKLEKVLRR